MRRVEDKKVMKTITRMGLMACLSAGLGFGATWTGAKLLDASCYDQNGKIRHVGSTCAPSASTSNFAFETRSGKVYMFDAASNVKAEKAIEDGVVKPNRNGDYRVMITGHREAGRAVAVKAIVHGERSEQ